MVPLRWSSVTMTSTFGRDGRAAAAPVPICGPAARLRVATAASRVRALPGRKFIGGVYATALRLGKKGANISQQCWAQPGHHVHAVFGVGFLDHVGLLVKPGHDLAALEGNE